MNWKKRLEPLKYFDPDYYIELISVKAHGKFAEGKKPLKWQAFDFALMFAVYVAFAYLLYSGMGFALDTTQPLVVVVSGSMEPVLYRGDVVVIQGVKGEHLKAPEVGLGESLTGKSLNDFAVMRYGAPDNECVSSLTTQAEENCKRFATGTCRPDNERIRQACQPIEAIEFTESKTVVQIEKEGDVVVYNSKYAGKEIIHRVVVKIKALDGYYYLTKGDNPLTNKTLDQDCGPIVEGKPSRPCINPLPVPHESVTGRSLFKIPLVGYVKLLVFGR